MMFQLNKLLGNKKLLKILSFFLEQPTTKVTQTEVIKNIKISKATAVKWLKYLVKEDLLTLNRIGVSNLYNLNNENSTVKQLKILRTIILLNPLKKLEQKDLIIYIYGSAARGEDTEKSDVDLLILGKAKRHEIIDLIDKTANKIKKKISFNIFNNTEWSMIEKKDKAYYELVEKDKIRI